MRVFIVTSWRGLGVKGKHMFTFQSKITNRNVTFDAPFFCSVRKLYTEHIHEEKSTVPFDGQKIPTETKQTENRK